MNIIIEISDKKLAELHSKAGDNLHEIAKKAGFDASYVSLVLRKKRRLTKKNFGIILETKKMIKKMEVEKERLLKSIAA